MQTPKILATLTLTTLAAGLYTGTAGATDTRCDGTAALTTPATFPTNMTEGNTYTISLDVRPECAGTAFNVADHTTNSLRFDPQETQALNTATPNQGGEITFTITPNGRCANHQLDLITGSALNQVDPHNRYNEYAIGGHRSRLITVAYVAAAPDCGELPPATTNPTLPPESWIPTTTIQLPETTTTTSPAVTTWRTTPLPDQPPVSIPPGSDVAIDPDPTTTPTPYTLQRLPETGVESGDFARAGLATALVGGLFCALAVAYTPLRRAMNNHRKDT